MSKRSGFTHRVSLQCVAACAALALGVAADGPAAPAVSNSSFEVDAVPGFPGYGTITDWSGSGPAVGLNTSAGPFWDNGSITSGTQCAFIQGVLSLTQNVQGFEAGYNYDFRIRVNYREASALQARLQVTVGTTVVIPNTQVPVAGGPAGTGNPFTLMTATFASPGTGTFPVKIENLESAGDNTLLLDEVEILPVVSAVKDWQLMQ